VKALFFVEPLLLHNRPYHYWVPLGSAADMAHALRSVGWQVRIVCNEALAERAVAERGVGPHDSKLGHGMPGEEIVVLEQEPIRRHFGLPNSRIIETLHRDDGGPAVAAYAQLLRDALGDFVPDVIFSVTPGAQLRAAFPDALFFSSAPAAYSRPPFPLTDFLDPVGLWDRSMPVRHAAALLAREPAPDERALLDAFRRRFGAYFHAVSPFGPLIADLRARHRAVGLLPLQFAGEPGFDCNAPFRSQGEYLFHVLENLPPDVALVVIEHPTARWLGDFIDDDTREFLAWRYPSVVFLDYRAADSAGQTLVADVDFVISVSSSIGLQALFFEKPLVAVGWSHLVPFATIAGMERFPAAGPLPPRDPRLDRVLCWFMSHYFIPAELSTDASWLAPFLERSVERARAGLTDLDFFDPVAPIEQLSTNLFGLLEGLARAPLAGRVHNGDFSAWSDGYGPIGAGGGGPDGWELLDFEGGVATVTRGHDAGGSASVRRAEVGRGATLFLQRVPDVASCAGALGRVRFRARSFGRATVLVYLYLQVNDGQPSVGTQQRPFLLGPEWQGFEHIVTVPAIGARTPGPGNHVEVVFMLPVEAGVTDFELAEVELAPMVF
jgi:Capsule polysaccharide biosynthesis protein